MYNKVLTQEQADFAAEHHDLIFRYLNMRCLPKVDYYDVAVFGYLSAVRSYFAREDLRGQYAFSTIAFSRMRSSVYKHMRSEAKRAASSVSIDEYLRHEPVERDTPEIIYIRKETDEEISRALSPSQKLVLEISAESSRLHELCECTGVAPVEISRELRGLAERMPALYEALAA